MDKEVNPRQDRDREVAYFLTQRHPAMNIAKNVCVTAVKQTDECDDVVYTLSICSRWLAARRI